MSQNEREDILRNSLGEKKQFSGEENKISAWERKKKIEERKERVGRALFDFWCSDGQKLIG